MVSFPPSIWGSIFSTPSSPASQVLRFYAFFQETVTERADENSRKRHIIIMCHRNRERRSSWGDDGFLPKQNWSF